MSIRKYHNAYFYGRKGKGMKKRILWIAVDLTVAALVVLAVWIVNYKIPQGGIKAVTFLQMKAGEDSGGDIALKQDNQSEAQKQTETLKDTFMAMRPGEMEMQTGSLIATDVVMDTQDWHEKFADKFTDTVVVTDTS